MFFEYLKENPVLAAILLVCAVAIVVAAIILSVRRAGTKNQPSPSPREEDDALPKETSPSAPPVPPEIPCETETRPTEPDEAATENATEDVTADTASGKIDSEAEERGRTESGDDGESHVIPENDEAEKTANEPFEKDPASETFTAPAETDGATVEGEELPSNPPQDVTDAEPEQSGAAKEENGEQAAAQRAPEEESKREKNKWEEGYMYLDDLKNAPVEEENDFYDEEDEADQIAKYNGKWTICRVVTANSRSAEVIRAGESDEETFFFELRASDGEKLLTSEEYTTYNGALNGIETHKANIARGNFKIVLSKQGDYMFKLLSGKNMLLCMGEHYATKARCESAIESTRRFAKTAIIDENVQDLVITAPSETGENDAAEKIPDDIKGKWVIRAHTAEDGEEVFYFELFASNGEKLLSSEEYLTYIGAINGIGTHKANIARGNFRISLAKSGDYIYKLLNGNGQLLCFGEHYRTRKRCENAIEWVKVFAKNSPILTDAEIVNQNS